MKIGFLSDIHEDVESLRKAISILEKAGCNELICLGDIVGYSVPMHKYIDTRNANECISIVRSNCSIVVPGNHDLYAIRRTPLFTSQFNYHPHWYDLPFDEREELADQRVWLYEDHDLSPMLSKKNRVYLESLEEFQKADFDGIQLFFSHYPYPDLSGSTTQFMTHQDQLKKHFEFLKINKCRLSFSGHRHVEGFSIAAENSFNTHHFDKVQLPADDCLWIDSPAICRSKKQNGILLFDSRYHEIQSLMIE